jgi:hypothetical protein
LESWTQIKEIFNANVIKKLGNNIKNENIKVLNIGCGNSTMSEDMYDEGFI